MSNIVTDVNRPDSPIQTNDIIVAISGIALLTDRIDPHLPDGDSAQVTVFRTSKADLESLLRALVRAETRQKARLPCEKRASARRR